MGVVPIVVTKAMMTSIAALGSKDGSAGADKGLSSPGGLGL
jgi:hypothetical protein